MGRRIHVVIALALVVIGAQMARADAVFTPIAQGAAYQSSTTLMTVNYPEWTQLYSVSDGNVTVAASTPWWILLQDGGDWTGWGVPPATENAHPAVLWTTLDSATFTLTAHPALGGTITTFGFEIEPDDWGTHPFVVTFMNGTTVLGSIQKDVSGTYGSQLFAASTDQQFTSVTIRSDVDFAVAELRYADAPSAPAYVPEPATLLLLGTGLLAVAAYKIRREF